MNKATLFDYARMCKNMKKCENCPLGINNTGEGIACSYLIREIPDKANEIILNWCKEHPVETRQDRFLKMFPNAALVNEDINICPKDIDNQYGADCNKLSCHTCKKEYWLAEVDENE